VNRTGSQSAISVPAGHLLLLRDRIVILSALGTVTLLSWIYLVDMARGMDGMTGAQHCAGMRGEPWTAGDFTAMLVMWITMMVGMMVPSAIPMVLIYASVARKAAREGNPLAPSGIFVLGYVVIWSLFSLGATMAQWALDRMALLSPAMTSDSQILGGLLLLTAGIYQLTPAKDTCLRHCRSPVRFVSSHWKPGDLGAFRMGIEHGAFCLGCCWILMGLLFFGGVMSLWWIGGLALFVLLEKVMPFGAIGGRLIGGGVAIWGLAVLVREFLET
jgi:predicted metal-binding membrane protein